MRKHLENFGCNDLHANLMLASSFVVQTNISTYGRRSDAINRLLTVSATYNTYACIQFELSRFGRSEIWAPTLAGPWPLTQGKSGNYIESRPGARPGSYVL